MEYPMTQDHISARLMTLAARGRLGRHWRDTYTCPVGVHVDQALAADHNGLTAGSGVPGVVYVRHSEKWPSGATAWGYVLDGRRGRLLAAALLGASA